MQAQIQKWGNSLGVRIPKSLSTKLNFKQGTFINMEIANNHLIISTETSELNTLLNNITADNRHHEIWSDDKISGNESW